MLGSEQVLKKRLFLVLLFMIFSASVCINVSAEIDNEKKIDNNSENIRLQEDKLKLEINKLESDIENSSKASIYQRNTAIGTIVTAVVSVATVIFTIIIQTKNFKMQGDNNSKQQMANYLSQLSSTEKATKIGAINALGYYEEALPYILNLLRYEEDYFVISALTSSLVKNADKSFKLLINEGKLIKNEKLKLAGEFLALEESEEELINLLFIDYKELKEWKNESLLIDAKSQLIQNINMKLKIDNLKKTDIYSSEKKRIMLKINKLHNLQKVIIEITACVIKKLTEIGKVCNVEQAYLPGISLSEADLSDWSFSKVDMTNAKFERCIFRGTKFTNTILKNTSFKDGIFKDNKFDSYLGNNCDFSKCKIDGVEFNHVKSSNILFKGAEIKNCILKKCEYYNSKFEGIHFKNVKIEDTKFFQANFMNANFNDKNIFRRVEFNGSRFDSSQNRNTEFYNCKVAGTRFDNSIYLNCKINHIWLEEITVYYNSKFQGNRYHEIIFDLQSEEFKRYVYEQEQEFDYVITEL